MAAARLGRCVGDFESLTVKTRAEIIDFQEGSAPLSKGILVQLVLCWTGRKHTPTFKIEMSWPVSLDMRDDPLSTPMEARIILSADTRSRGI